MPRGVYKRILKSRGQEQLEMISRKFGRLLVLNYDKKMSKQKRDCYLVRCDCGKEKVVIGYHLRSKHTQSCGCLSREISRKLGKKMCSQTGENHPAHVHGFDCKELHERVRRDAKYRCQRCGKTQEENGQKLSVHHKDGNHYNDDPENTEALCKKCHRIIEAELRNFKGICHDDSNSKSKIVSS